MLRRRGAGSAVPDASAPVAELVRARDGALADVQALVRQQQALLALLGVLRASPTGAALATRREVLARELDRLEGRARGTTVTGPSGTGPSGTGLSGTGLPEPVRRRRRARARR